MTKYVSDFLWMTNRWSYEKYSNELNKLSWNWKSLSEEERKERIAKLIMLCPPERYDYTTSSKPVPVENNNRKI